MKVFEFCLALWLVGVLFLSFNCFLNPSILVSGRMIGDGTTMTTSSTSKNLKNSDHGSGGGEVSLEDYRSYDPSPSSKAIRPGPINHGSPVIPYIPAPKPSPPLPSGDGGGDGEGDGDGSP